MAFKNNSYLYTLQNERYILSEDLSVKLFPVDGDQGFDLLLELFAVKELYEIRVEHAACVVAEIGEHVCKIFAGAVGASDGIGCRIEAVGAGEDLIEDRVIVAFISVFARVAAFFVVPEMVVEGVFGGFFQAEQNVPGYFVPV